MHVLRAMAAAVTAWLFASALCAALGRSSAASFAFAAALSWLLAAPHTDRLRPRLAATITAFNLVAVFAVALESGGTSAGIVMILAPVVLAVGLAGSPRAGAVVTAIAVAGIVALGIYEASGHDVGTPFPGERALAVSLSLIVTVFMGVQAHRVVQAERAAALLQADQARALAGQLQEAATAQERAALRKATFYATMSHEVRTPLGGLLGLMTALEGTSLDRAQRDVLEHMRTSGEALRMLVDDMLDLESFERGILRVEERVLDVRALLEDVVALYATTADAKGVALALTTPRGLPPALAGDPLRVRQIVQNLVNNALKFTDRGKVTLEATYEAGRLAITVRDTGRGIPGDRQGAIFQPFEQSDPTLARRYGGSGLGLAIVRHLVDAMGGSVEVDSVVGEGTTFVVRLPMVVLDDARVGELAQESARASHGDLPKNAIDPRHVGMRALIVDDDRINRLATGLVLRRFGVTAESADSGARALEMLDGTFDVAFLDLHMPEMLGTELAEHILARPQHPPYLVALSASVMPEDRQAALASGISEFLAKPLDVRSLAALLDRVPRRTPTERPPARAAAELPRPLRPSMLTPGGYDRELDRARLAELRELTGDRGEFEGLLRTFLQQLGTTIQELERFEHGGDPSSFWTIAHRVRGSAMNIGAAALAAAAGTAEQVAIPTASREALAREARELITVAQRAQRALGAVLSG